MSFSNTVQGGEFRIGIAHIWRFFAALNNDVGLREVFLDQNKLGHVVLQGELVKIPLIVRQGT
jgi:hypothetical protein